MVYNRVVLLLNHGQGSKTDSKEPGDDDPMVLEVEEKIVKFFATDLSNAFGTNAWRPISLH